MRQYTRFQLRQGTTAEWADKDPILLEGEPGYDVEKNDYKIGDGIHPWSELKTYVDEDRVRAMVASELATQDPSNSLPAHILDPNPHPVYDDGRSFLLIYQNAKV